MRILANYGYRNNGDSYSVTFETTGDVPRDDAPKTVDELFRLAKEAIQRQINVKEQENDPLGIDPSKDVLPADNNYHQGKAGDNDNGANENKGKNSGNGNAKITQNQKKFLYRLLFTNKKLSGDDATVYLKKEFNVRLINEIPCSQADLFIKKILQESQNSDKGRQKRGEGNGSY